MNHRHRPRGERGARLWPRPVGASVMAATLIGGCGGGGSGLPADNGAATPVPPSTASKATLSGQVAIGNGASTQTFAPRSSASRNFGITLAGSQGTYTFQGTLDGVDSSTTLAVAYWQQNSTAPDVVTLTTPTGTYTCGGLAQRACAGLTTTVAADRRTLTFQFAGVAVQSASATRTLTGQATAQFPAPLPYVFPSDLPTDRSAALTLDGAALGVLVADLDSVTAMPPSTTAREFTLSATNVTLQELPWGSANLGSSPVNYLCVTPAESGACIGLTFTQTAAAATYRFANVNLKEYRDGVVQAGRHLLGGTLTLPYPQASVNQAGTAHTLACGGDACTGTNVVYSGGGNIRHSIAVEQRSGGAANNGMTSIGYTYDLFNPADRMLTLLPGTGNGGFACLATATQSTGDCSGVRVGADGMTVVLDQVVVQDLAGTRRTVSGSYQVRSR